MVIALQFEAVSAMSIGNRMVPPFIPMSPGQASVVLLIRSAANRPTRDPGTPLCMWIPPYVLRAVRKVTRTLVATWTPLALPPMNLTRRARRLLRVIFSALREP